nr:MAG TPA: hypothetical protein [Bacteriophage sp.]
MRRSPSSSGGCAPRTAYRGRCSPSPKAYRAGSGRKAPPAPWRPPAPLRRASLPAGTERGAPLHDRICSCRSPF